MLIIISSYKLLFS